MSRSKEEGGVLDVGAVVAPMVETHKSRKNVTLEWRQTQLQCLLAMVDRHESALCDALQKDLGRDWTDCLVFEVGMVRKEARLVLRKLKEWVRPEQLASPVAFAPHFCEVRSVPLGGPAILILGPFNYPLSLLLLPAIGALAAGNPVLIKPSEACPAVSRLLAHIVPASFHPGVLQVVEGGAKETTQLLEHPWGLCFFTGSARVGKIVAQAAAKTLTPVVLELGGKSPVYIAEDCPDDMTVVANRIAWGKTINAGQTCIAPDYLLCHETQATRFCDEIAKSLERMFGKDAQRSELGHLISQTQAHRVVDLIEEAERAPGSKVVCGGSSFCKPNEKFVQPTVILSPPKSCGLLTTEIFGPVLPVILVKSDDEAIDYVNTMEGTPLALYMFTKSSSRFNHVVNQCPAANVIRNDVVISFTVETAPFGGLGSSGFGRYRGKHSFDTFSHKLVCSFHPCHRAFEGFDFRYHPYSPTIRKMFPVLTKLPSVPVLCTRALLTCSLACLVLFVLLFYIVEIPREGMMEAGADLLEKMAMALRKTS